MSAAQIALLVLTAPVCIMLGLLLLVGCGSVLCALLGLWAGALGWALAKTLRLCGGRALAARIESWLDRQFPEPYDSI